MSPRRIRSRAPAALLVAAGAFLLSGCSLITQVVTTQGPGARATATCGELTVAAEALDGTAGVLQQRLDALGLPEATVDAVPPDRIVVALPGGDDGTWRATLEREGRLSFVAVPPEYDQQVVDGRPLPAGMDATPIIDGSGLVSASLASDELGTPAISITLDEAAAEAFDAHAADNVGRRIAIVVDGVVVSAPVIMTARFLGEVQISGLFTEDEARSLVVALTSGPLPAPILASTWGPAEDGACPTR